MWRAKQSPRPVNSFVEPDMFRDDLEKWPFAPISPCHYDFIMADPPWLYELRSELGEEKAAQAQYNCMTLDEIKALPVSDLGTANCWLWLWATAPMFPQALEVMEAWGFVYSTSGVWIKTTVNGKWGFGPGYVLRNCHEPWIIAKRGNPKMLKAPRSAFEGEAREHSRKPEIAYSIAQESFAAVKRLELFSRTNRPGWDAWGDQAGMFNDQEAIKRTNHALARKADFEDRQGALL